MVTKLAPDLSSLIFSTFLGGSGDDFAWGLKMDVEDRPYVTGYTTSPDFPTAFPLLDQGTLSGSEDVFVSQIAADGSLLDFSTYLGGSGSDSATNGITVLNPGNVFVTGGTDSADFPVSAAPFQGTNAGGFDGAFTQSNNMDVLRSALLEVARKTMGAVVSDVLIVDIVRQDG